MREQQGLYLNASFFAMSPAVQAYQDEFVHNDRLNDIYRKGQGPAGVHSFYMYTWAAHGMDKVGASAFQLRICA